MIRDELRDTAPDVRHLVRHTLVDEPSLEPRGEEELREPARDATAAAADQWGPEQQEERDEQGELEEDRVQHGSVQEPNTRAEQAKLIRCWERCVWYVLMFS